MRLQGERKRLFHVDAPARKRCWRATPQSCRQAEGYRVRGPPEPLPTCQYLVWLPASNRGNVAVPLAGLGLRRTPTGLAAQAETGQPTASGPRRPHSRPAPARRTDPGPPPGDTHAAPVTTPRMELRLPGAGGAKARRTHPRCGRGEHHRRKGR